MSIHGKTETDTRAKRIDPVLAAAGWRTDVLETFKDSLKKPLDPDDVGGKNGKSFAQDLQDVDDARLPIGQIKRSDVLALAGDPSVGTVTVAAAVMAWGGMQMNFRDMLFKSSDTRWLDVATRFREGEIDRQEAYAQLRNLRMKGGLKGAGPAYFTKLIYFLTPCGPTKSAQGYIMDQWAGCSINLLLGHETVLMDVTRSWKQTKSGPEASSSFRVSDVNTETNYEAFCVAVDALVAGFPNHTADQIDRALIANGGRNPSQWRRYLIKHRTV